MPTTEFSFNIAGDGGVVEVHFPLLQFIDQ